MKTINYLNLLSLIIGLSGSLLLTACSDGTGTAASDQNGGLEISITDAEEDFLSYEIKLDAIILNRLDGTQVSVLPLSTDIDFVQYQELSELFAVFSVPKGIYSSITLSLDYSQADIVIQDENGAQYQAQAVNADGDTLSQLEVELKLNDDQPIRITPRKTAQLTLDLDLAASNTIESFEPAIVTVEPFMIGTTELDAGREHRVRGLLKSIAASEQSISLTVRPMRLKQGQFGEFTFQVNDATNYEIDGVEYLGMDGLKVMSSLSAGSPLVAFGKANKDVDIRYLASQVHAGSSVAWADSDVLKGIITQRSGNIITLEGAVLELAGQAAHFRQTIEMMVSEDSTVTGYRLGDAGIGNLSIGQQVLALGDFNADSDAFNAEDGTIRMKLNRIVGEVTQTSPLQIDVSHINKRPVAIFDFSGTGSSAVDDAQADSYQISTGALDLTAIDTAEWLQVRGYPTAFGSAPMDFDALSLINPDFSAHPAKLHARWADESTNNVSINNDLLVLNTETSRSKLHLRGVPGSSKLNLSVETISGSGEQGRYAILGRDHGIDIYREFNSFVSALRTNLNAGMAVMHLTATGSYSDSQHTLGASYITVRLVEANPETD